ncbi:MAG: hypothetical protein IJ767_08115 [Bacteroidaceae bacterium]|nr:hypothetical protein [Bacteroidaceae bacterium]
MSDTYHYEDGAIHNDHKRVLHIGSVVSGDLGHLMHAFFKDDVEEADVLEENNIPSSEIAGYTSMAQEEELNLFAPKKNLQELLKRPWFAQVRTDARYDAAWTDGFVEALMASEYGEGIARQWAVQGVRGKKSQLKGYVVGLLVDAGVLTGGYDAIARKIDPNGKKRTFSSYMGRGKKQPYAEWVKEYVAGKR